MSILIFSPFANFGKHPLVDKKNDPTNCVLVYCNYLYCKRTKIEIVDKLVLLKPFTGPNKDKEIGSR